MIYFARSQTILVHPLPEVFHQEAPPEDAPQLPHGQQALLVLQVRAHLQPEQQYAHPHEEVRGSRSWGQTAGEWPGD